MNEKEKSLWIPFALGIVVTLFLRLIDAYHLSAYQTILMCLFTSTFLTVSCWVVEVWAVNRKTEWAFWLTTVCSGLTITGFFFFCHWVMEWNR